MNEQFDTNNKDSSQSDQFEHQRNILEAHIKKRMQKKEIKLLDNIEENELFPKEED